MHTDGGRSFYSWTVLDPVGNRVKFGNTRSRAEAVLEAEKAIWPTYCIKKSLTPMSLNSLQQGWNDMTELDVIRKDAIRLAAVVVNLSKKYRPFQERVRVLGHRALNTRQLSDLEHVCQELRTVYARLLAHERSALAQEMDMDDPDLGLEPTASLPPG